MAKALRGVLDRNLSKPPYVTADFSTNRFENHSGEPALYIHVQMPSEKDIPDVAVQSRLTREMMAALEELGDERFPYFSFGPRKGEDEKKIVYDSED